jgi:hypothetical protein
MITPLGQRQMFQTVNVEAVRAALEVGGQFQREAIQKQALADRMAEDQASVPEIPRAEGLKTEERHGRRQDQAPERDAAGRPRRRPEDPDEPADSADPHMDFLA